MTDAVDAPIGVRAPRDGSGRLFVISQAGTIRVIKDGVLLPVPFLTVPVSYPDNGTSGLLGLAFHPNYGHAGQPHNDEFYVVSMRAAGCVPDGGCLGAGPDEVLERYTVSDNADVADPLGTTVLRMADTATSFHNGGDIHFGPDGYLYMSTGDGGQQNGTNGFAECLWKKAVDGNPASCGVGEGTQYFLRRRDRMRRCTRRDHLHHRAGRRRLHGHGQLRDRRPDLPRRFRGAVGWPTERRPALFRIRRRVGLAALCAASPTDRFPSARSP